MDFETHGFPSIFSLLAELDVAQTAFFLDFDGTLAEIVPDPARVRIKQETLAMLERLHALARGAVGVVSGRSIAHLDALLHPLRLPMAGVHGLERRNADGMVMRARIDAELYRRIGEAVSAFANRHSGLIVETKPGSVALHYRQRPDCQVECLALAEDLARRDTRIRLLPGKMVGEMTLATRTKGDAIADFMKEPPFLGRRPFFAGDDVTDEAGFAAVNAMGGLSVKVGPGPTSANWRLADIGAVARALSELTVAQ